MYLVDTNVVSEVPRGRPEAASWLRAVSPASVYVSVITLGEVMRGIVLKERSDRSAALHLAAWLQALQREYGPRILPITDRVSLEWGRLAAQRPRGEADGLIAATAIVHNLIIVTRNVSDFADTSASILNPWDL